MKTNKWRARIAATALLLIVVCLDVLLWLGFREVTDVVGASILLVLSNTAAVVLVAVWFWLYDMMGGGE